MFPISVSHSQYPHCAQNIPHFLPASYLQLTLQYVAILYILAYGGILYPPFGPCQSLLPRLLAYCVVLGPHLLSHVASAVVEVQEDGQVARPAAMQPCVAEPRTQLAVLATRAHPLVIAPSGHHQVAVARGVVSIPGGLGGGEAVEEFGQEPVMGQFARPYRLDT